MCKVKHAPKFYVRLATKPVMFPENFVVHTGSFYGRFQNANGEQVFWVCDDFKKVNDAYSVHILTENKKAKWEYGSASAKIQQFITIALRKLGRTPIVDKADLTFDNVRNMMKHSALNKKGSGARINTYQINPPLQWNEVTELAHWEGKGNAGRIANDIR